jgi:sporulation protein YlmC with PRC-barrel domain
MTLKNSVTTAIVVAALAIPAGAFAQTTTTPSPSSPPAAAAPHSSTPAAAAPQAAAPAAQATRHMREDQMRASKLIGSAVYDPSEQKIGTIDELVLNADGKVADVVLGVGGFLGAGEKHVAVAMADLKRGKNDHFVLNTTKDALKQMANFDLKAEGAARSGSSTHN